MIDVYRSPAAGAAGALVAESGNASSIAGFPTDSSEPLSFQDIGDVIKQLFNSE